MPAPTDNRVSALEETVKELSARLTAVEKAVNVVPKGQCVKGNDNHTCPDAGPYRYQRGCRAEACIRQNGIGHKAGEGDEETKVEKPKRAAPKKSAPAAPAKPVKKVNLLRGKS